MTTALKIRFCDTPGHPFLRPSALPGFPYSFQGPTGNIGREHKIREVIHAARHHHVPIRIGINAGSLEKDIQRKYGEPNADALVESAMRQVSILEKYQFEQFKLSVKASDVMMCVEAYRKVAQKIEQPLHLGITEAGGLRSGTVKSAVGLGALLMAEYEKRQGRAECR